MKIFKFDWNPIKNEILKKERNISFEKIIYHLNQGDLWKISDHPNQQKYPEQKIYYIIIDNYIFIVPFVEQKDRIFLKTIIPSRKATKKYFKEIKDKK